MIIFIKGSPLYDFFVISHYGKEIQQLLGSLGEILHRASADIFMCFTGIITLISSSKLLTPYKTIRKHSYIVFIQA